MRGKFTSSPREMFAKHRFSLASLLLLGPLAFNNLYGVAEPSSRPASAAQIEELAQALVLCPELQPAAAAQLDAAGGTLSRDDWRALQGRVDQCVAARAEFVTPLRYRNAYSQLKRVLDQAADRPAT